MKTAIEQQNSPVNGGIETSNQENMIGTEITPGTFRALEGKKTKTINQDDNEHLFTGIIYDCYENGDLASYYVVNGGVRNGEMLYFYPNGQVKEIKYLAKNTLEGIQKEYYENGVL